MPKTISILILSTLWYACDTPADPREAKLTLLQTLDTLGWCRAVTMVDNIAYVAADQAGVQIWDLGQYAAGGTGNPVMLKRIDTYYPNQQFDNVVQAVVSPLYHRLFVSERNSKVFPMTIVTYDSIIVDPETMSTGTEDFLVIDAATPGLEGANYLTADSTYILVAADRDDGLKWQAYKYQDLLGVEGWYEDVYGTEFSVPGLPTGVAFSQGILALSMSQLGIMLYELDPVIPAVTELGDYDTPGEAASVTWANGYLFVSADEGGAIILNVDADGHITTVAQVAEGSDVVHIDVLENVMALSCGSKGVIFYDISDIGHPESLGQFNLGYTYRTKFLDEGTLLLSSREGLQICRFGR